MIKRQEGSLHTEMEKVKSFMKLTPEERRKEAKRQMYEELKAMGRPKVSEREEEEKARTERKRQEAKQREEEEERRTNEHKATEKAKQHWEKVVECLTSDPRAKEQEKKKTLYNWAGEPVEDNSHPNRATCLSKSEAGCFIKLPTVEECLTSDQRAKEQEKKKTLYNNWVGKSIKDEPDLESATAPETTDTNPSRVLKIKGSLLDTTEREKAETPTSKEMVQWLRDRLNVGHWVDKYRDHRKRQDEKRNLKAEEQSAKLTTLKAGCASPQYNCYTEGAAQSRNRILKSIF